jgi:hypothetical protein
MKSLSVTFKFILEVIDFLCKYELNAHNKSELDFLTNHVYIQ